MSTSASASTPADVLISAQGLSRYYTVKNGFLGGESTVRALSDASFSLSTGKTLAAGRITLSAQSTHRLCVQSSLLEGGVTLPKHHSRVAGPGSPCGCLLLPPRLNRQVIPIASRIVHQ